MTDDSQPRIDPRFNPAFQRGFDPSVDVAEDATTAPPVARAGAASHPAAASYAAHPTFSGPVQDAVAAAAPAAVASHDPAGALPIVDTPQDPDQDRVPTRNPFLISLAIVAVLLIGAGAWLFARSSGAFDDPANIQSQADYMRLAATLNAAPLIMLLGAGTAVGVLFLFAIRWRGRR
ncbi:MAG: hypothetical protein JWR53_562 [Glaciihabitans sp.]|nr:hypothetical protein [Glaciihabitans sp.]